jgi:hypothetical protein
MIEAAMIVVVMMMVVPIIMAVVPIRVRDAVIIICTAMYTPMNTPVMAVVRLRLVHGQ